MTPTKREFEYIVIGLGGLGSGAAYWLARRAGAEVLGLEQFALGHDNGASEDHSRIIRLSYHTPAYVELARDAYAAWRAVEEDGDERLLVISGGLDLWPRDAAIPMSDYTESMDAQGVPYERLDADEIRAVGRSFVLRTMSWGSTKPRAVSSPRARAMRCTSAWRVATARPSSRTRP